MKRFNGVRAAACAFEFVLMRRSHMGWLLLGFTDMGPGRVRDIMSFLPGLSGQTAGKDRDFAGRGSYLSLTRNGQLML